ncbi:hypothetical protein VUR80DRAFT_966 [Thermomyces stellatus]
MDENNPFLIITDDEEVFYQALRARELFPRDDDETCVKCEGGRLTCDDSCKEDEGYVCKQVVSVDNCRECPSTKCVKQSSGSSTGSSGNDASSSGPNTGVIVGAVIGGVVGIAAITFLIWRFCIKNKRHPSEAATYDDVTEQKLEAERDFNTRRDQRSSMHTIHSIASTVLTRASNIIQIAYIPGVTNRATPTSPNVLVPPVPPIPVSVADTNSRANYEDQHFFMPGDLRDSTYSGYTDRTSYARTSYAPRSSVASTIYGKNVVVSTPQTGMRAKPTMISMRSAAGGGSDNTTPPVPVIDYEKYNGRPRTPDSTFSIGSAFMKNANASTATPAKAQLVRVASGRKVDVKGKPENGATENPTPASAARSPLARASNSSPANTESTRVEEGPFLDPPETTADRGSHSSSPSLSAVIEEATRRAAHVDRPTSVARERSPFGDEHATKD